MIVVYTAVFGNYDELEPVQPESGVRFVAFTDRPKIVRGWEVITPSCTENSPSLENRKYKALPHQLFPRADWTLYLDGNLSLTVPVADIIAECHGDVNLFRHNVRSCVYDEATACRAMASDRRALDKQVMRYRSEGYPTGGGLFWGGLLARRPGATKFNELWWHEITHGSGRDQVSLPYCFWKLGMTPGIIEGDIPFHGGDSRFVSRKNHSKNRNTEWQST